MTNQHQTRTFHRQPAFHDGANMTTSEAIVEALPYLRRYARAVTGSSDRGDRYIRHFIEVVLSYPNVLTAADDTKLRCFALFHEVCRGLDIAEDTLTPAGATWIERQLAALQPVSRELLLLVHLEGFTISQAARIVGIAGSDAGYHLLIARFAFRRSMPKLLSSATAWETSRFPAASQADDPTAHDGSRPRQAAWYAARQVMRGASWPAEPPPIPRAPHPHEVSTDLPHKRPGLRRGPPVPGREPERASERGSVREREALEVWETEGGATDRAATAAPGHS